MSFQIQACIAAVLLACAGFAMAEPEPVVTAKASCRTADEPGLVRADLGSPGCAEEFFAAVSKKYLSR